MTDTAGQHTYSYDPLYQLTGVDYPEADGLTDTGYTLDPVGNRQQVVSGAGTGTDTEVDYVTNALNQYTRVNSALFTHDLNGNLTSDGTNSYTFSAENRLLSAATPNGTASYGYDPLGRRISKTVNGEVTRYLYDGDQIIAETDGAGSIQQTYIYGPGIDEPLKGLSPQGTVPEWYYHADGLGSIVALTDSDGQLIERYRYDVYGVPIIRDAAGVTQTVSSVGNRFFFTGREYDAETGLYYYRARYYDPGLGRFLQRDPIGVLPDMNLYRYVGNNPVNWVDPLGLDKDGPSSPGPGSPEDPAFPDNFKDGALPPWLLDLLLLIGAFIEPTPFGEAAFLAKQGGGVVAGRIAGYTRHGINQAISREGRGVSPQAILNAVRNPQRIIQRAGGIIEYVGEAARVLLNEFGQVVTVISRNRFGFRIR